MTLTWAKTEAKKEMARQVTKGEAPARAVAIMCGDSAMNRLAVEKPRNALMVAPLNAGTASRGIWGVCNGTPPGSATLGRRYGDEGQECCRAGKSSRGERERGPGRVYRLYDTRRGERPLIRVVR